MALQPRVNLDCRAIELTCGHVAIVDGRDHERLSQWRWRAQIRGDRSVYAVRQERIGDRRFHLSMHQIIVGDVPAGHEIYHANGWGLDNRRINLVIATPSMGRSFQSKIKKPKTSRFKGVYLMHRTLSGEPRWAAWISVDGRHIYLGVYDDEIEAAEAHDMEAVRHFGPRAFLNFPHKLNEYLKMVQSIPDRWADAYTAEGLCDGDGDDLDGPDWPVVPQG